MDAREERLARNETLFRSVNENIEAAAITRRFVPLERFVVASGHELPEIEAVIARKSSYQVVAKRGEAAEFVTERDPRS